MKLVIFLVVFFFASSKSAKLMLEPLVLIKQGLVKGEVATDGHYAAFFGIPYAEVDLQNPFGTSLPAPTFGDEVFIANNASILCPQSGSVGTLDCLRLNIFIPTNSGSRHPLPVLFWIHGGGFSGGKAKTDGVRNIVEQGIIVVTINYRLGVYGFMCLDHPSVPGNQGLKDQQTALRWVRDNIAAFGGNPNSVTIGGQSAGGGATICHLFSQQEKLFHQAIAESGIALGKGFLMTRDEDAAMKLAKHLGFNTTDTDQALQFLSRTSPNLLTAARSELGLSLKPCKEKIFEGVENFINTDIFSMSSPSKVKNTAVIIGSTSNECYGDRVVVNDDYFGRELKDYFNIHDADLTAAVETLRHFYIGDKTVAEDVKRDLEVFCTDLTFNKPVERTITQLLEHNASSVYQYLFNYVSENDRGEPDNAPHTANSNYFWASSYDIFNEEQKLVSDRINALWTNFIKFGNPTPQTSDLVPITWEPTTKNTRPFLKIEADIHLEDRYRKEAMAFWKLFYLVYGQYEIPVQED